MLDKKISELEPLSPLNLAPGDLLVVVDVDAGETKNITVANLKDDLFPYATSTTPQTIGTGTKAFITEAPRSVLLAIGFVLVSDAANETRWMVGKVKSYNIATRELSVDVQEVRGSGNGSNWKISLSGPPKIFYSATKAWRLVIDDNGVSDLQEI